MYELKKIKEDMEVSDLTILNVCDTRWLSWSNVINNFHYPFKKHCKVILILIRLNSYLTQWRISYYYEIFY